VPRKTKLHVTEEELSTAFVVLLITCGRKSATDARPPRGRHPMAPRGSLVTPKRSAGGCGHRPVDLPAGLWYAPLASCARYAHYAFGARTDSMPCGAMVARDRLYGAHPGGHGAHQGNAAMGGGILAARLWYTWLPLCAADYLCRCAAMVRPIYLCRYAVHCYPADAMVSLRSPTAVR